jgi:hypothetical protein
LGTEDDGQAHKRVAHGRRCVGRVRRGDSRVSREEVAVRGRAQSTALKSSVLVAGDSSSQGSTPVSWWRLTLAEGLTLLVIGSVGGFKELSLSIESRQESDSVGEMDTRSA